MLKKVTVDQFLEFDPCWEEDDPGSVRRFAGDKMEWTALDVLLANGISNGDKLWAVLREEFIDAPALHEFACRVAERALSRIEQPDPRSLNAIATKRAWLRGEVTDAELDAAGDAAWSAAGTAARDAAGDAARDAGGGKDGRRQGGMTHGECRFYEGLRAAGAADEQASAAAH